MNYIYFDFDGTLADSLGLGIEIANYLAPKHGFESIDISKIEHYRSLSSQELVKEFKVPFFKLPILAPIFKIEMKKRIEHLKPIDGVPEMLKLFAEKYYLGILTSNNVDNVEHFLDKYGLRSYISDIRSEFQLFGKHNSLKKIISHHNINKKQIIYVGDETRDIEATNKAKIKSVAVTWGFNSDKALKRFKPDKIAYTTEDIISFVESIYNV